MTPSVMTTIKAVLDFVYFHPFLFSLYHHPEPSGTFYNDSHTTAMTYIPDHSSMTQNDIVTSMSFRDFLCDSVVVILFTIGCTVSSICIAQQLYFTLSLVFVYFLTISYPSHLLSSLSSALSSESLTLVPLNLYSQRHCFTHTECTRDVKLLTPSTSKTRSGHCFTK